MVASAAEFRGERGADRHADSILQPSVSRSGSVPPASDTQVPLRGPPHGGRPRQSEDEARKTMWSRALHQRLHPRRPQRRRPSLFCCALIALAALSLSAQTTLARELLAGQAVDVEDAEEPLHALIRCGVRDYEKGDLSAADAQWARIRDLHPEHPAAAIFELKTLQARRSLSLVIG